jgi:hypothetical protein
MTIIFTLPSMTASEISVLIIAAISVVGNVVQLVYSFRNNASSIKNDIIKTYETRLQQVEMDNKNFQSQLTEQRTENAKLQGVVQTLERVLENRDPKLQQALDGILVFMQKIELHMEAHDKLKLS